MLEPLLLGILSLLASEHGLPPRRFDFRSDDRPTVKVWTDAAWEPSESQPARVAYVVFFPAERGSPARWVYGDADVPQEVMASFVPHLGTYIGQLEMLAAVGVYFSLPELAGRRAIHWIDNQGCIAALIKGYAAALRATLLPPTLLASCTLSLP